MAIIGNIPYFQTNPNVSKKCAREYEEDTPCFIYICFTYALHKWLYRMPKQFPQRNAARSYYDLYGVLCENLMPPIPVDYHLSSCWACPFFRQSQRSWDVGYTSHRCPMIFHYDIQQNIESLTLLGSTLLHSVL